MTVVRRALVNAENLGYNQAEVTRCICSLSNSDFDKVWSDGGNIFFDVYKPSYIPSFDRTRCDPLYMKLKISDGEVTLLGSFKLE